MLSSLSAQILTLHIKQYHTALQMQAADPDLRVAVRFRPEKSGYLTYHGVEAPPQIPADHGARQWLYMIGDAARQGRASSTMWRDEHGRVSGAAGAAVPFPACCPPSLHP